MCELCDAALAPLSRRRLMFGAAATLAASAVPLSPASAAEPASDEAAPNAIAPEAALQRLMQGNERYGANAPEQKDFSGWPRGEGFGAISDRCDPELLR